MQILLANPRGFCSGVRRAIDIVNQVLRIYRPPIFVYHEIVHNTHVVRDFREKGVIFVHELNVIPNGSVIIFSAHGVSELIEKRALEKKLIIFDATCPLVSKIHKKVSRFSENGIETIMIGHKHHPEVIGTIGRYKEFFGGSIYLIESVQDVFSISVKNEKNLRFITQTTLSWKETTNIINALHKRFPKIRGANIGDICYATINRQTALIKMIKRIDLIFVVGSKNSSNSKRLVDLAHSFKKPAYLIDSEKDIRNYWIINCMTIGIISGASVPEYAVKRVINYLTVNFNIKKINEQTGYENDRTFNSSIVLKINN